MARWPLAPQMDSYEWWRGLESRLWWELREDPDCEAMYQKAVSRHIREVMKKAYDEATREPTAEEVLKKAQEKEAAEARKREEEAAEAQERERKSAQTARRRMLYWMQYRAMEGKKIRKCAGGRGWRRQKSMPCIYENIMFLCEYRMEGPYADGRYRKDRKAWQTMEPMKIKLNDCL